MGMVKGLLVILFWIIVILGVLKLYIKLTTGWCRSNVCLVGKTAIVTGANTGIGYETAEDFAKRGARVILACRDATKGKEAAEKIIKATDNQNVVFKPLDLSSFKSIRDFAKDINKTEERLDILVNNAGAGYFGKQTTDGLLTLMLTNYFGPFFLTNLLIDLLRETSNSRIVNVSSVAAKHVRKFDTKTLNIYPENMLLADIEVYARSKLCNILFTIELNKRLKGTSITAYSLHPGLVATELIRAMPVFMKTIMEFVLTWLFKVPIEGAQTTIYCSVAKGIEPLSGQHFHDCHVVSRYGTAKDSALPELLWKETEKLRISW